MSAPLPSEMPQQKPRQRGDGSRKRCRRQGCTRPKAIGKSHCSVICFMVDKELARAESLCREAGYGKKTAELWATAVELSDAMTHYLQLAQQVRHQIKRASGSSLN